MKSGQLLPLAFSLLGALGALALPGCISSAQPETGTASLRVRPVPENAMVRIDDETVVDGRAIAVQPVRLRTGRHLVSVEADGYFPHDMTIELPAGETAVDIRLRPLPP